MNVDVLFIKKILFFVLPSMEDQWVLLESLFSEHTKYLLNIQVPNEKEDQMEQITDEELIPEEEMATEENNTEEEEEKKEGEEQKACDDKLKNAGHNTTMTGGYEGPMEPKDENMESAEEKVAAAEATTIKKKTTQNRRKKQKQKQRKKKKLKGRRR